MAKNGVRSGAVVYSASAMWIALTAVIVLLLAFLFVDRAYSANEGVRIAVEGAASIAGTALIGLLIYLVVVS